jgi:hypothetical protein
MPVPAAAPAKGDGSRSVPGLPLVRRRGYTALS